jgi:hypothetical protein
MRMRRWLAIAVAALAVGCSRDEGGADGDETTGACVGSKCDEPDDESGGSESTGGGDPELDQACWDRRAEAFDPNHLSFTPAALRWSCSDIDSTPPGERGQEYCEYFVILQLPDLGDGVPEPMILGLNLGAAVEDGQTPFGIELYPEEIDAYETDPAAVAAQCVFTSWNADVDACAGGCTGDVMGVPVAADPFRMKIDPNTRDAAVTLIEDCTSFLPPEGDASDPEDPYHDPFFRACHLNAQINETQHRKSDNVICGASVRMAECGCALGSGAPLAPTLAREGDLGFPLGTWSGVTELPAGCRHVEVDPGTHHVVACDLSAAEVVQNQAELKSWCREKYADDVVVHVPIPAAEVVCTPPTDELYADGCAAQPWVLQP